MISPSSSNPTAAHHHTNRIQASAIKVFEEAGGTSDLFIPGVGEKYEDLAADFLENWLVNDTHSFEAKSSPENSLETAKQEPASELPEATFTAFSIDLDWQLSNAAKS